MFLLTLNDVALTLRTEAQLLYQQPAQALHTQSQGLLFGDEAAAASRLHPLDSNNTYLNTLSSEPLPRPLGDARNYADLVYQHLLCLVELTGERPVCLGVPASFSQDQLAILLGIAKEAGLRVSAFVDSAVLGTSVIPSQGQLTYVDVQARQVTLTRLEHHSRVQRIDQQVVVGAGAQSIVDGWVNVVADRFVQATRFDPLHSADSEQQLYNRLNQWRHERAANQAPTATGELVIDIQLGADRRRAVINEAALLQKTSARLAALDESLDPAETLVLSPLAAQLPGLYEHLQARQHQVQQLHDGHIAYALATHPDLFDLGDSVRLFVELDLQTMPGAPNVADSAHLSPEAKRDPPASTPPRPARPTGVPTHVLSLGLARSIDQCLLDSQLPIARSADGFRVMPSESPIASSDGGVLEIGTLLTLGQSFCWQGDDYQLIAVEGS